MTLRCLFAAACILAGPLSAELSLAQTKSAKDATVLIAASHGLPLGSGFCVSEDGYVLTSHHIVERLAPPIRVVLHPGEAGQQTAEATVVRSYDTMGLALLRLSSAMAGLTPLPLGDTATLAGAAPLTIVGCSSVAPEGTTESVQDSCPVVGTTPAAMVVRPGSGNTAYYNFTVTGALARYGCGGPVLDGEGKVVGMAAGKPDSETTYVVSVNQARIFLTPPELVIEPVADIPWDQRFGSASFRVRADSILPPSSSVTCQVSLLPPDANRVPSVQEDVPGRTWIVTAPLLGRPAANLPVKVRITTADAVVVGTVPNRPVTFATTDPAQDYRWELFEMTKIVPGEAVECRGGFSLAKDGMQLGGLEPLVVPVAGQNVTVPVAAVKTLEVLSGEPAPRAVRYGVSLLQDGRKVASTNLSIRLQRPPWETDGSTPPAEGEGVGDSAPTGEVRLPARYTDCIRAGGGRYLLLPMPSVHELAVFDVREMALKGTIPLADEDALVAGGRDRVFVASATAGLLERWSLEPLKRERRLSLPFSGKVCALAMGANADGPLLVVHSVGNDLVWSFVDGQSLAAMAVTEERSHSWRNSDSLPSVQAADCGTLFGVWDADRASSEIEIAALADDNRFVARNARYHAGYVLPGPNGDLAFTSEGVVYTSSFEPLPTGPVGQCCLVPSSHPAYYLGLDMSQPVYRCGGETRISFYIRGISTPVLVLPRKLVPAAEKSIMERSQLPYQKRYHFLPQFRLLALLPFTDDRVVLQRVDIEEAMQEREIRYLFVESTPPSQAQRGTPFRYQIAARTSAKSLTYKLDSGPEGMTISPTGEVVWEVPATADTVGGIIVSVTTDDGQSLFHTFNLKLVP